MAQFIVTRFHPIRTESSKKQYEQLENIESEARKMGYEIQREPPNEIACYEDFQLSQNVCNQFLLGFIEAEGSFMICLQQNTTPPFINIVPRFQIGQKGYLNAKIIEYLQKVLSNCGSLYFTRYFIQQFDVRKTSAIVEVLIPFFEKNLPVSAKFYDYEKFRKVFYKKYQGALASNSDIDQCVQIAFSMNKGSVDEQVERTYKIDHWLFYLHLSQSCPKLSTNKTNIKIIKKLVFDWYREWTILDKRLKYLKEQYNIQCRKTNNKPMPQKIMPMEMVQLLRNIVKNNNLDYLINSPFSWVNYFYKLEKSLQWFHNLDESSFRLELHDSKCVEEILSVLEFCKAQLSRKDNHVLVHQCNIQNYQDEIDQLKMKPVVFVQEQINIFQQFQKSFNNR